uniref:DoxX family protein n=1 Tax=Paenirhodobacter enshiensis TaxID=1105367 RepID=UPI0035ADDBA2
MDEMTSSPRERLILPFMAPFYHKLAQPYGWAVFRIIIGGYLALEGWPKILAPMSSIPFAQMMGFYPGWLFSPLLSVVQFFGGLAIALGVLTRPVALANAFVLVVTLIYHYTHPYGQAFLTPEGIAFLKANAQYLTEAGQKRLLSDGGAVFLGLVQGKAELGSIFWAAGAAIIAAFGGGKVSLDRLIGKEF